VFALIAAEPAFAQECEKVNVGYQVMRLGDKVVAVWYPTAQLPGQYAYSPNFSGAVALDAPPSMACGRPVPLVVFSHGDFGCGLQSIALTEELARHGYVVAAPDHADAFLCHTVPPRSPPARQPPQPDVFKPEAWTEASFADRRDDIRAIIDVLLSNGDFRRIIDPQSIGAAGHSLGGYTVVGMVGGWHSWLDPRVRAVLALSPYVMPFQVRKTLKSVRVPLMYQGGTLDVGITPFLKGATGAYREANPPVFFVELRHAAHLAWVNCGNTHTTASCLASQTNPRLIDEYGIAFFDRYLKHKNAPILSQSNPELADFQFRLQNE
jgi:predicted dienelactone hydrolase